ncbi:MAG: single-stranded-DNA-specific exonuclease RecJ, partial [bacterium]
MSRLREGIAEAAGRPAFPLRWSVREVEEDLARRLARDIGAPPLLGRLLLLRGVREAAEARAFLAASLDSLHDPFLMKGMEEAAGHLARQVLEGRPIGVYGDYDVDGISATALLQRFFSSLGLRSPYYIPHRLREGYGLHSEGLRRLREEGCETVVTVDCGITGAEAAEEARRMGIALIVTDHHRPPERLPDALAVLNPHQPGCGYPFADLSGVGVAFKLAAAVRRRLHDAGFSGELPNLRQHLDLVALGTVADVVPLLGENHVMVRTGLELLSPPKGDGRGPPPADPRKAGVRALIAAADLKADALTAGHVGFTLGPRLNAAGRVGDPRTGVELLTSLDAVWARACAEKLEEWNRQRRDLQEEALEEAAAQLAEGPPPAERGAIVLASDRWHPGVIGIVASRLVEEHLRPVILVHFDGEEGKGSGRGAPGFHLYDALARCADLLVQFGGHKAAAGLTVRRDQFEAFCARFEEEARARARGAEADPAPGLELDAEVDFAELDLPLLERLEGMAPFGMRNPRPLFAAGGVEAAGSPGVVGKG